MPDLGADQIVTDAMEVGNNEFRPDIMQDDFTPDVIEFNNN